MDPDRWSRIKRILGDAMDMAAEDRAEFVQEACGSDSDLLHEILSLIQADQSDDSPLDEQAPDVPASFVSGPLVGERVRQYELLSHIGSGGMGDVFLAFDTVLGRRAALKFLPPYLSSIDTVRLRFAREARAAAALTHPNIVTIYEVSEHRNQPFIAMEHVEGESLRQKIDNGLDDIDAILHIAIDICNGLSKAHSGGVVHRDIKPENIILSPAGGAKILDFGIAKSRESSSLTSPGSTPGTANYMSPEQARGETVDHRSDIFSLGVILCEMITGKPPFSRESVSATINAVISESTPLVSWSRPEISQDLQKIIDRALAKNRSERFQSVDDLATELGLLSRRLSAADSVAADVKSIAVLYLRNLGDPHDEYLCHGVTEDLIVDLTRIASIRTTSMRRILEVRDSKLDLKSIGEKLDVDYILDGSILKRSDTVRLSAQLLEVQTGKNIWASRWEESSRSLPRIKQALAIGVSESLGVSTAGFDELRVGTPSTSNTVAYEHYLRGKYTFEHRKNTQDLEVALGLYRKAIELDSRLILARAGVAEVLRHQGNVDEAREELLSSLDLARNHGMKPEQATIQRLLAELHTYQADWDTALGCCTESLIISKEIGDIAGEAKTLGCQILILLNQAKFDQAIEAFNRVIEINRHLKDEHKIADALKNMGRLYRQKAQYDKAEELYEEALGLARKQGNRALESACLGNIGGIHLCRDNYEAALRHYEDALEIDQQIDNKSSLQAWHTSIAHILRSRGEFKQALDHISKGICISKDLGDRRVYVHSLGIKGDIFLEMGEYESALEAAEEALRTAEDLDYRQGISGACINLGYALGWAGRCSEAESSYKRALQLAKETGLRRYEAWAYLLLGMLQFNDRRSDDCEENLNHAMRIASEIGDGEVLLGARTHLLANSARRGHAGDAISKMRDTIHEYRYTVAIRDSLLMQRLLGQTLVKYGDSEAERDEGRELLRKALSTAESNGLMTEVKLIRALLN